MTRRWRGSQWTCERRCRLRWLERRCVISGSDESQLRQIQWRSCAPSFRQEITLRRISRSTRVTSHGICHFLGRKVAEEPPLPLRPGPKSSNGRSFSETPISSGMSPTRRPSTLPMLLSVALHALHEFSAFVRPRWIVINIATKDQHNNDFQMP